MGPKLRRTRTQDKLLTQLDAHLLNKENVSSSTEVNDKANIPVRTSTSVKSGQFGPKNATLFLSQPRSKPKPAPLDMSQKGVYMQTGNVQNENVRKISNATNLDEKLSIANGSVGSSRVRRRPVQLPPIEKEFTFTGYDIMADEEPTTKESLDSKEVERRENVQLYMTACRKLGIIPVSFIANHINDRTFVMKSHSIGPTGAKAIAIALVENRRIRNLDLEDNGIGAEGAQYIASMLQGNDYLQELNISENLIGTRGASAIASVLCTKKNIKVLDISGSNLVDSDAQYVAGILDNNRSLKVLRASHNKFGEIGGLLIGPSIANNDTLHELDISWNHLRGKGAMAVAYGLQKNVGLRILNIAWNGFGKDGSHQLGRALIDNRTLTQLDVTNNRIWGEAVGDILKGVQNNDTLTTLKMGMNPISHEVATTILKTIQTSDKCIINTLDLSDIVVDEDFVKAYEELKSSKKVEVTYGPTIKGSEPVPHDPATVIDWRDPITRLFNYMHEQGYRVIDLLKRLDRDRSLTVDRDEFKKGMLAENIPLTESQLDEIIERLDIDKDGEVDFGELIAGEKDFRRRMHARLRRMMKQSMPATEEQLEHIQDKLRQQAKLKTEEH